MIDKHEYDAFEWYYATRRRKEKAKVAYFLIQKLLGLLMLGCAVVCWVYLQEYTASTIFFVPMGLLMLFTKERIIK